MTERNEQTGDVAKAAAAKILPMTSEQLVTFVCTINGREAIKAVAASALTQAPPRKKFLGIF